MHWCQRMITMLALAAVNSGCIRAGLTATTISSSSEVNDCGEFYSGAAFAAIGPSPADEFGTFTGGCRNIAEAKTYNAYAKSVYDAAYELAYDLPVEPDPQTAAFMNAMVENAVRTGGDVAAIKTRLGIPADADNARTWRIMQVYCAAHRDDPGCALISSNQWRTP